MSKHRIPTIAQLRQAGFRVEVTHHRRIRVPSEADYSDIKMMPRRTHYLRRWPLSPDLESFKLDPRGGLTEVEVWAPAPPGAEPFSCGSAMGRAECSNHDMYNRSRGVEIALGRALKALRHWGVDAAAVVAAGRPRPQTISVGEQEVIIHAGNQG